MDLLKLKATIGVDSSEYDKGLDNAKSKLSSFGGALTTGLATAAKAVAGATAAAGAAVAGLTKAAVTSYADYEQLVGGVETLFGSSYNSVKEYAEGVGLSMEEAASSFEDYQKRADDVFANASQAYKTAGMSTNEYMETVTGFAASLNASLGEYAWQSANYADMAVGDMSDNANKMGSSMESIKNAYAGFAKQNFTMLDNLKLGYGGTKEEMERLLRDAEELEGLEIGSYDENNFADVVSAIHTIQEELGIYGTTAKEATETITGSLNMTKAAWANLVTGLADKDADMSALIGNLVDSIVGYTDEGGERVKGFVDNLLPAIEQALIGIGDMVSRLAPIITEKVPEIIAEVAPSLISAAWQMVTTLGQTIVEAVPQLLGYINEVLGKLADSISSFDFAGAAKGLASKMGAMFGGNNVLKEILSKGVEIVSSLVSGIGKALPELIPAAINLISSLATDLTNQIPTLISAAVDLVIGLAEGLTEPTSLSNLVDSAITLIMSLADGLIDALPKLIEAIPTIIENLITAITENAPKLITSGLELIIKLEVGLIKAIPSLVKAVPQIIGALVSAFVSLHGELIKLGSDLVEKVKQGFKSLDPKEWGRDMINSFVDGIKSAIGKVKDAVKNVANTVKSYLHFSEPDVGPLSDFHTYAPDMMKLFAQGMADNDDIIQKQMQKSFALPDISADVKGISASNNVVINVYGAEGQDEEKLAQIVSDKLLHEYYKAGAAYA